MTDAPSSTRPRSHSAAIPSLLSLRDVLTERFLRWPVFPKSSPMRGFLASLGIHVKEGETGGMVGFGVGLADDDRPDFALFTKEGTEKGWELYTRLKELGVPTTIHKGVSFVSAAAARPVKGGDSLGHGVTGGETGTMGCVVRHRSSGEKFALTCNHVIADLNRATRGTTDVWAPGAKHSGTASDKLGVVHDFANIDFQPGAYNIIDAALAKPDDASDLDAAIVHIGAANGANYALALGDKVKKTGAESGFTTGKYRYQINAMIEYAGGAQQALFRDMFGIVGLSQATNFGKKGDSGAVILDDSDAVAGQLISVANGIDLTLASSIKPVLDQFDVDVV